MEKTKNGKTASRRMHKNRFWQRGEALTEQDVALLKPVVQQALKLGRSPTRREVDNLQQIRMRFRIWEDVLYAIGLPSLKDPEQVRLRDGEKNTSK
ncbi:MAG: hypothetical protein SOR74_01325 [Candidatus Faecivicinus sp.]|nr:hypothetical protein [Candidatus Faecivicinus sp.]